MSIFSLLFCKTPNSKKEKFKWFLLNFRNSSIIKLRRFKRNISNKKNIWSDYSKHFNYVSEYYPAKNIMKAPIVQKTMFDKNARLQKIKSKKLLHTIIDISNEIESSFFISKTKIKAWLSIFGSIIEECDVLEPDFEKFLKSRYLIEFGPGLGFNAEIYSRTYKTKAIFFDLSEITDLRSIVFEEFKKASKNQILLKPEEYTEINSIFKRVSKLKEYSFFSSWAFTESPLNIRNQFFDIIDKSIMTIIVSNPKFENIDNFEYLSNLALKLNNHQHVYSNLGFLEKVPKYLQKHHLHLFINKNYKK